MAGKKKVVLVVVAHADDLEFLAGGTVALFVQKGYDVYELIVTDNSKGSYVLDADELVKVSEEEAKRAGEILGLKEVRFLRYVDGTLADVRLDELREKFMRTIRELKVDVLMTWDPFAPYESHPDHRQVAMASLEAADFADIPLYYPEHFEDGLEPRYVGEKYFFAKSPVDVNKVVDISSTIDLKIEALLAHDCQMKLTVDGLKREAEAAGLKLGLVDEIDRGNYQNVIEMAIRAFCAEVGQKTGVDYAEQFRYTQFGMLARFAEDELDAISDF